MDKLLAMQTFVQVAQTRGFTAAAEVLGLPKASVSQRISALEAHLGVRLLQRSTRRVSLTQDGQAYYAHCLRLLDDMEAVEAGLRSEPGGTAAHRGQLRIDTLPSIARWILAPALPDWVARYPHLSLQIGCTDRVVDLLEEGVDCAVRGGPLPDSSLVARRLCTVTMGLYAAPAYLRTRPSIERPEQLQGQHWVGRFHQGDSVFLRPLGAASEHSQTHPGEPGWVETRGAASTAAAPTAKLTAIEAPAPRLAFNEGESAVAASVAGLGLVIAPPFAVEQALRAGQLQAVLPQWAASELPLSLVYPSHRQLSPRLRCFVDWFTALAESHPSLKLTPAEAAAAWSPQAAR